MCAFLCISTTRSELPTFTSGDCFAALCLAPSGIAYAPPKRTFVVYQKTPSPWRTSYISRLCSAPSCARRLWRFLFPIIIEEVAEIVFDIPFRGEVGRFLCQLLDGLVAFLRDRIARIDLTPRPPEG